jgi:hypothetical protein
MWMAKASPVTTMERAPLVEPIDVRSHERRLHAPSASIMRKPAGDF